MTEKRRPPKWQRALNTCGHQGGEWGGETLTQQRAPTVCSQGPEGDPQTRQHTSLARGHGMEEEEGPQTQQRAQTVRRQGREGDTPTRQRATQVRSQGEEKEGYPHGLQCAYLAHRQGREGATPTRK